MLSQFIASFTPYALATPKPRPFQGDCLKNWSKNFDRRKVKDISGLCFYLATPGANMQQKVMKFTKNGFLKFL